MTPFTIIEEEARGAALQASLAAQAARRRRAARGDHPHARGEAARRAALKVAAAALKARDGDTSAHSDDVVLLCRAIADRLGIRGREREDLIAAAKLHDLGKVAVPMQIIEKPGPLTAGEWQTMRQHTLVGQEILDSVQELHGVAAIVRSCHERFDGAGYPDGLAGEDIPLAARVVFCADAFHAIREDRPYRKGRSAARALAEVRRNSGTQFDPRVVKALESAARELRQAGPERLGSLSAPLRSRRLLALLATMMIGGSALAAGVELPGPFSGSDEPKASAAPPPRQCGAACVVDLGRFGRAFPVAGPAAQAGAPESGGAYFDFERELGRPRAAQPLRAGGRAAPVPGADGLPGAAPPGEAAPGDQGLAPSAPSGEAPDPGGPTGRGPGTAGGGRPGMTPPASPPVDGPARPIPLPGPPVQLPDPPLRVPDVTIELPNLPIDLPGLPVRTPDTSVTLPELPRLP